jgi:2'-5' RNA ligase
VRLFAAVEIDAPARAAIADEQRRLARAFGQVARNLRLVKEEQLHLTLVFVGEVDAERAAAIVSVMSDDLPLAPFRMAFSEGGAFPSRRASRLLSLGVADGGLAVCELQRQVVARLEALGVVPDPRPFVPHLTLARWRDGSWRNRRWAIDRPHRVVATIAVDSVSLFESRLSPGGPVYTRLTRARLLRS